MLSSLFDFHDVGNATSIDLTFGPTTPADHPDRWVQTIPGAGWFIYFRIYGPESEAFDGGWRPGDFQRIP